MQLYIYLYISPESRIAIQSPCPQWGGVMNPAISSARTASTLRPALDAHALQRKRVPRLGPPSPWKPGRCGYGRFGTKNSLRFCPSAGSSWKDRKACAAREAASGGGSTPRLPARWAVLPKPRRVRFSEEMSSSSCFQPADALLVSWGNRVNGLETGCQK